MGAVKAALVTCTECGNYYLPWQRCQVCPLPDEDEPVAQVPFTPETAPDPIKETEDAE